MKQIEKTPDIIALLKAANVGVSLDGLAVYEAAAFNTLPIRKRSRLYKGAVANRSVLVEMADELAKESLPVHIMHNSELLPIGRVFHGKVVDLADRSEIRVLFFLDANDEHTRDIDLGIVDQVSVSILPKQILCSECSFDFLGEDADFENIWLGECDKGHVIGEEGVHGRLIGLDSFMEMSLVGRGGAQKARIINPEDSAFKSEPMRRLAANGIEPSVLVLTATTEEGSVMNFDISKHINEMAELKVELSTDRAGKAAAEARVAELEAQVAELTAKVEASEKPDEAIVAKDAEIAELTEQKTSVEADRNEAVAALKDAAQKILTLTGQVDAQVPDTVVELKATIDAREEALRGLVASGGRSRDVLSGRQPASVGSNAFKSRKSTR